MKVLAEQGGATALFAPLLSRNYTNDQQLEQLSTRWIARQRDVYRRITGHAQTYVRVDISECPSRETALTIADCALAQPFHVFDLDDGLAFDRLEQSINYTGYSTPPSFHTFRTIDLKFNFQTF